MRGYYPQINPSGYVEGKWQGQRVNFNGTSHNGKVLRAFWQGAGQPVRLSVAWDDNPLELGSLTDSEHVTIVREA